MMVDKCLIVEGRSDRLKLAPMFAEGVLILCTNGSISEDDLLNLVEPYEHLQLFTMFDRDKNGEKLRKLVKRTFSDATQLTVPKPYIEVADTPAHILSPILRNERFKLKSTFEVERKIK